MKIYAIFGFHFKKYIHAGYSLYLKKKIFKMYMFIAIILKYLQVMYHAEFEKTKGKLTQVADDPETLRIKQNSRIIRYSVLYFVVN